MYYCMLLTYTFLYPFFNVVHVAMSLVLILYVCLFVFFVLALVLSVFLRFTEVIKFTSCLPMVGCFLRVLRLLPPLKLVAMTYGWNIGESGVKHDQNQIKSNRFTPTDYIFVYFKLSFRLSSLNDWGPSCSWSYGSWIYNYIWNKCRSLLTLWVLIQLISRCNWYNNMWYNLSVTGRWFSPVSSTNKTDNDDMTEILLKVALNTTIQTLTL